jgi:hypothetical protein
VITFRGCGAGLALLFAALPVHAQSLPPAHHAADEDLDEARVARGFAALNRPTGIAEVGVGWLTLPGASVCAADQCKKGDTSFALDAWELFRTSRRFAFGAGFLLGLIPTTDAPPNNPMGVVRDHSRSYLTLEGTIRHYPYIGQSFELWWGITGGLAVVNDRFEVSNQQMDLALVGGSASTIRTEGGSIGAALGGEFWLANHWSMGTAFRYGNWFLPNTAAKDPLLEQASLTGRNTMFSLGISLAYRIPL